MKNTRSIQWALRVVVFLLCALLGLVAFIYFRQHSMIYHPRPYDENYMGTFPPAGLELEYNLPEGKQMGYYVPGQDPIPQRLWLAFCGNGSLALDWMSLLRDYPRNGDAFLLVDYPGYGRNAGYATIGNMRASTETVLHKLCERLNVREEQLDLCAIGHSLGAAVALDFGARHRLDRIVLISPFTTLREEGAEVVGGPLSYLLSENYDNRANLAAAAKRNPAVQVAIFHGDADDTIPVRMGRDLAQEFPFAAFFEIKGGDHVNVLTLAHRQIVDWMDR